MRRPKFFKARIQHIFIGLLSILIFGCKDHLKTLKYENCDVTYNVYPAGEKKLPNISGHSVSNEWELESAKRKLAICLCERYLFKPSIDLEGKILELYYTKETYFSRPIIPNISIDSIVSRRKDIFDPRILID